jgi:hypothetical protein
MVVEVTMKFFGEPTDAERQGMIKAAMKLTKNPTTISVEKSPESPKALLAVFRMKNEAGYKAVDPVARMFRKLNPSYNDMSISFEQEKAYDLRMANTKQ